MDWIIIGILCLLTGAIVFYLLRQKKQGKKCIGCPHSGSCPSRGGCEK